MVRLMFALFALFSTLACSLQTAEAQPSDSLPAQAYLMPFEFKVTFDPNTQQQAYYDFMWQTFIAINWPWDETGRRGQPNVNKSILDQRGSGPLDRSVWETYREPGEIFLPPSQFSNYPEWDDRETSTNDPTQGTPTISRFAKIPPEIASDINQPDFFVFGPTGPLVDQHGGYVRYEVAVNESYFTYIRNFKYYDSGEQVRAVQAYVRNPKNPNGFQIPPNGLEAYAQNLPIYARQGLVEVKAAWRPLVEGKDDFSRYLHREIVPIDVDGNKGQPILMGLVALHILRFTPNGRVACTFEQVDNVRRGRNAPPALKPSFNNGDAPNAEQKLRGFEGPIPAPISKENPPKDNPTPVDIYRVTPIPEAVAETNKRYQAMLGDSVFSYYELINTQNRHPGDDFSNRETNGHQGPITGVYTNVNNLVNSALESYTQNNYSCILCHVQARPLGVDAAARELDHFKILSFLLRNAQPPLTSSASSKN